MKKLKISIAFLLILSLQGCAFENPKYIHFKEKPQINFYTNEVYSKLLNNENYSIEIFNTNLYKSIPISDEDKTIIENFIRELTSDNFSSSEEIPEKEAYQIRVKYDTGERYVFKIYNENIVTLYPWDGNYTEDIITMENVPLHFNLYDFCRHIENQVNLTQ